MNTNRDRLDDAIDAVSRRMTSVPEDDGLGLRITAALPDRSSWAWYGWIGRVAVGALASLAIIVVMRAFDESSTNVQTDVQKTVQTNVQTNVQTDVQTNVQTDVQPNARPNARPNDRMNARPNARLNARLNDRLNVPDHDFSLPSIESIAALNIDDLTPASLPEDAPLTVESLQISDLPLTAEFSPR
jgi:hypothetical protein